MQQLTESCGAVGASVPGVAAFRIERREVRPVNPTAWMEERARVLKRICKHVAARVQAGRPAVREVRRAARHWNGKAYRSDPARRWQLSYKTLIRVYYNWRKIGEAAFHLQYATMQGTRVPRPVVAEFIRICLRNEVEGVAPAVRLLARRWSAQHVGRRFPWSMSSFYRAMPGPLRRKLARIFRDRAAMRRSEAVLRRELGEVLK